MAHRFHTDFIRWGISGDYGNYYHIPLLTTTITTTTSAPPSPCPALKDYQELSYGIACTKRNRNKKKQRITGNSVRGLRNNLRLSRRLMRGEIKVVLLECFLKKVVILECFLLRECVLLPGTLFVANGIACASKVAIAALMSVTVSAVW
jgi:hypothetical protein